MRWALPKVQQEAAVAAMARELSLPLSVCSLLVARGMIDPAAVQRFLQSPLSDLAPPSAMLDLDRAVERIVRAIRGGETILVHGDYDVDGITSTTFLTRVFRALGGRVVPFVPNRMTDGYDLTDAGVRAAVTHGASLVVTCDCGTSAVEPVKRLRAAGIDTIITDHHLPGGPLPDAIAVLNPRRPDCAYPDKDLVAGGVAFKLALGVLDAMEAPESLAFDLIDLVALATVADVAPLRGENRILVRHGLRKMAQSSLPGMRALLRASGLDAKELTAGRIGFVLAPRLNATGRIGSALRGVELLLTDDDGVALGIARELEELNRRRQDLDRQTLDAARRQLDALDMNEYSGIVLAGEGWHPGVIGIVASRIVEETARPTVLVALENGIGKGSGRSIPAFDLHGALVECRELFVRFGGHRAAAGVTLETARVSAFAERFNEIARSKLTPDDLAHTLHIDLELPIDLANDALVDALKHCEPYGVGNPAPVFLASGVSAAAAVRRIGETGIRTRLAHGKATLDAVAWDFAHRIRDFNWSKPIDVVYRLERDEWQGRARLQARIADIRQ